MAGPEDSWSRPSAFPPHNETFTLQKYLLLQGQHESLRQHLALLQPEVSSTAHTTPLGSPTRAAYHPGSADSSPYTSRSSSTSRHHSRSSSSRRSSVLPAVPAREGGCCSFDGGGMCLATVPDEATLLEVAAEEAKLFDVNEGIKRALTELLNCDAVRSDRAFRTWVQRRLMDTEKELRIGRKRRSAAGYDY